MHDPTAVELERFEAGGFDSTTFAHRDHVRIGYELLRRHVFTEAACRFARGLRSMAGRAGRPEVYHDTITVAFLALIAERMTQGAWPSFDAFAQDCPQLLCKDALMHWYDSERLMSPLARRTFVLPNPATIP